MESDERWDVVADLYARAGVRVYLRRLSTPSGTVYSPGAVALGHDYPDEPYLGLHELAHWLIARDGDRERRNFGLGDFALSGEYKLVKRREDRSYTQAQFEEDLASMMNVHLAQIVSVSVGDDSYEGAERVARSLSVDDYYNRGACHHLTRWCWHARRDHQRALRERGLYPLPRSIRALYRLIERERHGQ